MKEVLRSRMPTTSTTSSVTMNTADATAITFDDRVFGSLVNQDGSAQVTLLDFENGIRTDQIIDVEANEKRKRGAADQTRRVRTRMDSQKDDSQKDDLQTAQNTRDMAQSKKSAAPAPVSVEDVPDEETPGREHGTQTSQTSPPDIAGAKPKFRLGSELNKSITVESIGEKVMEAPIQLKMCELLAVSTEVSNYLHDQTRRKRIPITGSATNTILTEDTMEDAVSANTSLTPLSDVRKPLYACPSARTKVCLDDDIQVEGLLDDGSELNIMAKRTFEKLQRPIDTDINWRINGYDAKAEEEITELRKGDNLVGVCHEVLVDIGGVAVKQHIFVVKYLSSELILGRPWERMTRAQKSNMDNGSYVVKIKSLDGRRMVEFLAVPAKHDRIREHVRPDERGTMVVDLKEPGVRH